MLAEFGEFGAAPVLLALCQQWYGSYVWFAINDDTNDLFLLWPLCGMQHATLSFYIYY